MFSSLLDFHTKLSEIFKLNNLLLCLHHFREANVRFCISVSLTQRDLLKCCSPAKLSYESPPLQAS